MSTNRAGSRDYLCLTFLRQVRGDERELAGHSVLSRLGSPSELSSCDPMRSWEWLMHDIGALWTSQGRLQRMKSCLYLKQSKCLTHDLMCSAALGQMPWEEEAQGLAPAPAEGQALHQVLIVSSLFSVLHQPPGMAGCYHVHMGSWSSETISHLSEAVHLVRGTAGIGT